MTSHKFKSGVLIVVLTLALCGMPSTDLKLDLVASPTDEYVEIQGSGITFVPLSTKCVKYRGEVKKISRFSIVLAEGELDCQCPNCCNGECYIVVFTEIIVGGSPVRVPAIIWIPC
jgi:hypothetical protein